MSTAPDYLTGRPYPPRFHREHAPSWIASVMAALGFAPPSLSGTRLLEVGCGQGAGCILLALANPAMRFHGIDLNPDHIARARAMAAGVPNVTFTCADVADLTPEPCDFIVSHGVHSWVGAQTRADMTRFMARALTPGGVLCLHYMTAPGGSAFAGFHAVFRACLGHPDPVAAGLSRLAAMRAAGAGFFQLHPHAGATLDHLLAEDPDYIAHDYLNPHFHPLPVAEVMADMQRHGLSRIGSATGIENIDALSLPSACAEIVARESDPALRETLKDVIRNQALRYDLFMRPGPQPPHMEVLRGQRFARLPGAPQPGRLEFSTRIGSVEGEAAIFAPLLRRLHEGPAGFADLEGLAPFAGRPGLLNQALQMLQWSGAAHPLASGPTEFVPRPLGPLRAHVSTGFGTARL